MSPASIALIAEAIQSTPVTDGLGKPDAPRCPCAPVRISISRPPMKREDGIGLPEMSTLTRQSRPSDREFTWGVKARAGVRIATNQVPVDRTVVSWASIWGWL